MATLLGRGRFCGAERDDLERYCRQRAHGRDGLRRPSLAARPLVPAVNIAEVEAMAQQLVANGRIPAWRLPSCRTVASSARAVTASRRPRRQPVDAQHGVPVGLLSKSFAGTVTGILVNDGVLR